MKKAIIGNSYIAPNGAKFEVLNAENYPAKKVSNQFKQILALKPGHLVAVPYRGILIPNITVEGGVVRLTAVNVAGNVFDRPKAISQALGIQDDMMPYVLNKAK